MEYRIALGLINDSQTSKTIEDSIQVLSEIEVGQCANSLEFLNIISFQIYLLFFNSYCWRFFHSIYLSLDIISLHLPHVRHVSDTADIKRTIVDEVRTLNSSGSFFSSGKFMATYSSNLFSAYQTVSWLVGPSTIFVTINIVATRWANINTYITISGLIYRVLGIFYEVIFRSTWEK